MNIPPKTLGLMTITLYCVLVSKGSVQAAPLTFTPGTDPDVSSGSPTRNLARDKSLRIDASPATISYVKFTLAGLSAAARQVTLKFHNARSSAAGSEIGAVSDTAWSQGTVAYVNGPQAGDVLARSESTNTGPWTRFDGPVSSMATTTPPQPFGTAAMSSIIPTGFEKALGAYDPGLALSTLPTLAYDHYFVSWDMGTQWIGGVNQHQALLQDLAASRTRNRQPIVTLEPWSVAGLSASNLLSDVVAGKYDANIQWACADLATYDGTVLVRWGHEMENVTGRYPWATNSTSAYISAYRYFVDRCRALAPNTRYVWSPTGNRNLGGYWPGPSYVDYVGLSVYNHPDWEVSYYGYARSFHENFSERYNYVAGYGKPVIIAEFGATGATQVQWLADALADMRNFPLLQAANFFDAKDPAAWGALPAPDWRVDPAVLSPPN